ncbi:MAG: sulfite exporter TauE/SafE family protein [Rhodospirillales bacterium]|nr:sulfite exporter TauE/SafE family protein [Rhodospirillales bacterium]
MLTDPFFYALAIPAFLLTGISKGGFGGGLGSMGVPLMALAIPVPQAAAIMLPLLMVMDVVGVWRYRRDYARGLMGILLLGAVIGTALGYAAFSHLDDGWIRLLIGVIAVLFPLKDFALHALGRSPLAVAPNPAKGVFWSTIAGVTSFIANAGSPPIQVFLLPLRLDKTVFVATTTVYFAFMNAIKLGPYISLGLFTPENLATSAILLPLALAGIFLGLWLHARVPDKPFYFWCNVFLFVTGLKLVWDGARIVLFT